MPSDSSPNLLYRFPADYQAMQASIDSDSDETFYTATETGRRMQRQRIPPYQYTREHLGDRQIPRRPPTPQPRARPDTLPGGRRLIVPGPGLGRAEPDPQPAPIYIDLTSSIGISNNRNTRNRANSPRAGPTQPGVGGRDIRINSHNIVVGGGGNDSGEHHENSRLLFDGEIEHAPVLNPGDLRDYQNAPSAQQHRDHAQGQRREAFRPPPPAQNAPPAQQQRNDRRAEDDATVSEIRFDATVSEIRFLLREAVQLLRTIVEDHEEEMEIFHNMPLRRDRYRRNRQRREDLHRAPDAGPPPYPGPI